MNVVISNPDGIHLKTVVMTDKRWPANEGWIKKAQGVHLSNGTKIDIHYVYNEMLGLYDDFKFKD